MATLITQQRETDWSWLSIRWNSDIKRFFYIYGVPSGSIRGLHRHKKCRMGLVCLTGSVEVYTQTPQQDQHFRLDSPTQILLLDPTDWRVMHTFSSNAMLVVFADQVYMDTTYIDAPYRGCHYYTSALKTYHM